jgi:CubicO group peptidase (beta-lactamase class C family)
MTKGGKYYGDCLFSNKRPGSFFQYSNLGYGIIGTVVEKISNTRFDIYTQENILKYITTNQT